MKSDNRASLYDNLFVFLLPFVVIGFFYAGSYFRSCKLVVDCNEKVIKKMVKTQFIIRETVKNVLPEQEKKIAKTIPVETKREVVDLSEKPLIKQDKDDIHQNVTNTPLARRVYGLQKVYSTGLGNGGNLSDAVIGKLGNTLNTAVDTFKASKEDIKGQIVSTTTVTTVPHFVKMVKPEYNKEMLANKTEGVVKVKALVDIDGKVKKATILTDLGFDSGAQAVKATLAMEFTPAMRGVEPVAVWIVIPIRFVMVG
jgi:TonB family protein